MYQTNTKNKSFQDTQIALGIRGVRNNNFMLQLYDETLTDIDPWSADLHPYDQMKVMQECSKNFWYYAREVIRIPLMGGDTCPLHLDIGNAAVFYNTLNSISTWRTNIRHTFATASILGIVSWMFLFRTNMEKYLITRNSDYSRVILYEKLKSLIDKGTPPYFSKGINVSSTQNGSSEFSMFNKVTHSKIFSQAIRLSKTHNENFARGLTSNVIVFDEAEFLNHFSTIFDVLQPIFSEVSRDQSDKINAQLINSTHGEIGKPTTKFAMRMVKKLMPWTDKMYDISIQELKNTLSLFDIPIVYIFHTREELGRSNAWFSDLCKTIGNEDVIDRELLGYWS